MIKKIIPLIIVLIGLLAGIAGGTMLRPHNAEEPVIEAQDASANITNEFVKLSNQFVVPIVEEGRVASLVIMSLSVEVSLGATEAIFSIEPKLRDAFLQVMFDHANAGGFRGVFTDGANLILLRRALTEVAQKVGGESVKDVLIIDISRQDG